MPNLMSPVTANTAIPIPQENRPQTQKMRNSVPREDNINTNSDSTQNDPQDFKKVLEKHISEDKNNDKVEKKDKPENPKPTENPNETPEFEDLPALAGQITAATMKERIAKLSKINKSAPKDAKATNKAQKTVPQQKQAKQATVDKDSKPTESKVAANESGTHTKNAVKTTEKAEVTDSKSTQDNKQTTPDVKEVSNKTSQAAAQVSPEQTAKTTPQPDSVQNTTPDEQKTQFPASAKQKTDTIKPQQVQERTETINNDSATKLQEKPVQTKAETNTTTQPQEKPALIKADNNKTNTTTQLREKPVQTKTDNNETNNSNTATTDKKTTLSEKKELAAQKDINELEANTASTKIHNESNSPNAAEVAAAVKAVPISQPTNHTSTTTATATVDARSNINAISDSPANPAQQIIQSIRMNTQGPQQELNINLNPSELGTVRIRFQQINGEITGTLEVDNPRTRYEIEKELPGIVASLQNNGLQVRRVDVSMSKQQDSTQSNNRDTEEFNTPHQEQFNEASHNKNDSHMKSSGTIKFNTDYSQTIKKGAVITDNTINVYV